MKALNIISYLLLIIAACLFVREIPKAIEKEARIREQRAEAQCAIKWGAGCERLTLAELYHE